MSIDNSIRAIAYSEADTLAAAVALVAKRRNDLEAAMRADATRTMPVATEGAAAERAVEELAAEPALTHHVLDRRV